MRMITDQLTSSSRENEDRMKTSPINTKAERRATPLTCVLAGSKPLLSTCLPVKRVRPSVSPRENDAVTPGMAASIQGGAPSAQGRSIHRAVSSWVGRGCFLWSQWVRSDLNRQNMYLSPLCMSESLSRSKEERAVHFLTQILRKDEEKSQLDLIGTMKALPFGGLTF